MNVYICYELCTLHHRYYTVQNILYILHFTYYAMCKLLFLGQHLHTTLCNLYKLDTLCIITVLYTIQKTASALTIRTILQIIDYTDNYPYCIITYYTLHTVLDALYCTHSTVQAAHTLPCILYYSRYSFETPPHMLCSTCRTVHTVLYFLCTLYCTSFYCTCTMYILD